MALFVKERTISEGRIHLQATGRVLQASMLTVK